MSPLTPLRSRLKRVVRRRRRVRYLAALAAAATGWLLALAGYFLLDLVFRMDVVQRLVVTTVALVVVTWCWLRFSQPLVGVRETVIEMALAVQRRTGIDGDLVAGLQFERAGADDPSSARLREAVVRRAAEQAALLDLSPEVDRRSMARRVSAAALVGTAWGVIAYLFPGHTGAFLDRLMLGPQPYPTRTLVVAVAVNGRLVPGVASGEPRAVPCAEARPVAFAVRVEGNRPPAGQIRLAPPGGTRGRALPLVPLDDPTRRERIQQILAWLSAAIDAPDSEAERRLEDPLRALFAGEVPELAGHLQEPLDRERLREARKELGRRVDRGSAAFADSTIYVAELPQVTSSLDARIDLGDAWLAPFRLDMLALPLAELTMVGRGPAYARTDSQPDADAVGRDLTVLEGSSVRVEVRSAGKQLVQCWMHVAAGGALRRVDLQPAGASGLFWQLDDAPELRRVAGDIRVSVGAIDSDGLPLAQPLEGRVRVRPDRAPLAVARAVHQVVLAAATPVVEYQVDDDFGIARITLAVTVERRRADEPGEVKAEPPVEFVIPAAVPLDRRALPAAGRFPVPLEQFRLDKGDRLKLSLQVIDDRGSLAGAAAVAEPIFLLVSDEAGVLEAVTAADEASDRQLDEIISRQLGTGKHP